MKEINQGVCFRCKCQSKHLNPLYNVMLFREVWVCDECFDEVKQERKQYAKNAMDSLYSSLAVDKQLTIEAVRRKAEAGKRMDERFRQAVRFLPYFKEKFKGQ